LHDIRHNAADCRQHHISDHIGQLFPPRFDGRITHQTQHQHSQYEEALRAAGADVTRLPACDDLPDSVFVEDTAVVFDEIAVVTRPGAASRRDEVSSVRDVLATHRTIAGLVTVTPQRHQLTQVTTHDRCSVQSFFLTAANERSLGRGTLRR